MNNDDYELPAVRTDIHQLIGGAVAAVYSRIAHPDDGDYFALAEADRLEAAARAIREAVYEKHPELKRKEQP